MREALREAMKAAEGGEVPTGCVIVRPCSGVAVQHQVGTALRAVRGGFGETALPGKIIARAHNQTELLKDATAHAEILAITQASAALGDWRLTDTILYVTKEPCAMCAGAIVLSRIPLVVWGFSDPLRGGHSVFSILNHDGLNHRPEIIAGVLETDCREMFQAFFRERRN
jgi:tRNA(adenine34) deaminase